SKASPRAQQNKEDPSLAVARNSPAHEFFGNRKPSSRVLFGSCKPSSRVFWQSQAQLTSPLLQSQAQLTSLFGSRDAGLAIAKRKLVTGYSRGISMRAPVSSAGSALMMRQARTVAGSSRLTRT